MNGCCVRRLLSHQLATFSANSARSARARCTPPALAKVSSGPVTLKLPSTFNKVVSAAGRLDRPGGIGPRGTAPVDPAPLDRAASGRMVIGEFGLATKHRHGRPELDPHRSLIDTALAGFGQHRAGNARSDCRRVGEDRPQHLGWHRDRNFLSDRDHGAKLTAITGVCRCTGPAGLSPTRLVSLAHAGLKGLSLRRDRSRHGRMHAADSR